MKKFLSIMLLFVTVALCAQTQKAKNIDLTFAGVDDANIFDIETVTVDNLTTGASLTLSGKDILRLTDDEETANGIDESTISIQEPMLYPNPAFGDANLVVDTQNGGTLSVTVYSANGRFVASKRISATSGRNSITIPTQQRGMYIVRVEGCGVKKSIKWMCNGGVGSSSFSLSGSASAPAQAKTFGMFGNQFGISAQTADDVPEVKAMLYKDGEWLRLTAKVGNRTTIMYQQPKNTHTVTFGMFECVDANGRNYPIVEAGGMMWMAEDLRVVDFLEGVGFSQSAGSWAGSSNVKRMAYYEFDKSNANEGGYFTPQAAAVALPQGWSLPTTNDLESVMNLLGGENLFAGALKAKGYESLWESRSKVVDSVGVAIQPYGWLQPNGEFFGLGSKAYLLTKTTKDLKPIYMTLEDGKDKGTIDKKNGIGNGYGFRIRGVRPAVSAYYSMLTFLRNENSSLNNAFNETYFQRSPLGDQVVMSTGKNDIISDTYANFKDVTFYVLGSIPKTYSQVSDNKFKGLRRYPDTSSSSNAVFNDWDNSYYHKKIIGQTNNTGRQNTVLLRWLNNRGVEESGTAGSGKLELTIYGDATKTFTEQKKLTYTDFTMPDESGVDIHVRTTDYWTLSARTEAYAEHLKLKVGDLTGNGIDDLVFGVGSKVFIVDGYTYATIAKKDFGNNKNVRVAVGDVNGDRKSDIVFMYSNGNVAKVECYCNGAESVTGTPTYTFSFSKGFDSNSALMDVAIGDVTGDKKPNIICHTSEAKAGEALLTVLQLNSNNTLELLTSIKEPSYNGKILDAHALSNNEIVLPHFRGLGMPADIFVHGSYWRYEEGKFSKHDLSTPIYYVPSGCVAITSSDGITEKVVLNDIIYEGVGLDIISLVATRKIFSPTNNSTLSESSGENVPIGICANTTRGDGLTRLSCLSIPALATVRTSEIARVYRYVDSVEGFTEPNIYALLAAPPYFEGHDYITDCGTSWGSSSAQGDGTSRTSTNSSSLIVGYEHDINIITWNVGNVSFENELKYAYTFGDETINTTEYGINYSTVYDDAVILQITPYITYFYECVHSENPDEIGSKISINVPDRPRTMPLNVKDYMLLRADNAEIPDISKVFTHTPGEPFSYPRTPDDIHSNYGKGGILWGTGSPDKWQDVGSAGSTTLSITVTKETNTTTENSFTLDTKLVATVLGAKIGFGYGHGETWGSSHTESVGHSYSGTVPAPRLASGSGVKNFSWNLCKFNYQLAGQQFPVIYYVVKP